MDDEQEPKEPSEEEYDYTKVSWFTILAVPACLLLALLGVSLFVSQIGGRAGHIDPSANTILLIYIAFVLTVIAGRQK